MKPCVVCGNLTDSEQVFIQRYTGSNGGKRRDDQKSLPVPLCRTDCKAKQ